MAKIKRAIAGIKEEIKGIDLAIGFTEEKLYRFQIGSGKELVKGEVDN